MKPRYIKAVKRVTFLLLFLIIGVIILDLSGFARKWLKVNNPVNSNTLICEGWLSPYYYDSIVSVFNEGNYGKLVVTGSVLPKGVLLSQNGIIIIKGFSPALTNKESANTIRLQLKGSKSDSEFAKCIVSINNHVISDTIEAKGRLAINFKIDLSPADSIVIRFFNDRNDRYSDRNLLLKSCIIDTQKINLHSQHVWLCYHGIYANTDARSYPENMAKHLICRGIPKNKVFYLTSSQNGISKTYNTASDAVSWLKSKHIKTANVITADYHARRTCISYQKADHDVKIGIISLPNQSFQHRIKGKLRILKELSGCIFIRIMPKAVLNY
jgi:uncharacterized SAM-binding protein YcdF (DUF218 family)